SLALSLVFLCLLAFLAGPALDGVVREMIGESRWRRLIALACLYGIFFEILSLPIAFWSGYLLEHRFQLSNLTPGGWLWRQVKGCLVGGPLSLVLVLGQLAPVLILPLFYKVTRLDDEALLQRLRRLADGTGLQVEGIYRLHLSE